MSQEEEERKERKEMVKKMQKEVFQWQIQKGKVIMFEKEIRSYNENIFLTSPY